MKTSRVRFLTATPSMCWDPIHGRLLSSIVAVDRDGRIWQTLSADGPGPWSEVPAPDQPQAKVPYKTRKPARK